LDDIVDHQKVSVYDDHYDDMRRVTAPAEDFNTEVYFPARLQAGNAPEAGDWFRLIRADFRRLLASYVLRR
jgi:hypothetical protein